MDISVIIATYNRCNILKTCLNQLTVQSLEPKQYEVIVIDDGSTDQTKQVCSQISNQGDIHLTYLHQKNLGQGTARNLGIKKAQGSIIIFINDDIIVDQHFLEEHLHMHKKFDQENIAVLGFIDWHPDLKITPFMKWLTNGSSIFGKFGGHQFAFEKLHHRQWADYNFFYTSNLSLKKSLLEKHQFDTDFNKYGWEDIELGYRLTKEFDLKIRYNRRAIGYHYHPMDESSLAPRMRMVGKSAHIFHRKHPELQKVPTPFKKFIFHLISNRLSVFCFKALTKIYSPAIAIYYYALSKRYFLQGLNQR